MNISDYELSIYQLYSELLKDHQSLPSKYAGKLDNGHPQFFQQAL